MRRLRFLLHNKLFELSIKVGSSLHLFKKTQILKTLSKTLNEISNNGFSLIPNYYQDEEIESLNRLVDRILNDSVGDKSNNKGFLTRSPGGIRIYGTKTKKYPQLVRYCFDKLLLLIGFFFYQKIKIPASLITITHDGSFTHPAVPGAVNAKKPPNWEKHIDTSKHYLKALILLEDIDMKNGPTAILSKSNKSKSLYPFLLKNFPINRNNVLSRDLLLEVEKQSRLEYLTGKRGDLILIDTSNVHWASPFIEGCRKILWLYF